MVEGKPLDEQASASHGFSVGTTLVARWMGKVERMCIVIDRGVCSYLCDWKDTLGIDWFLAIVSIK